MKKNTKSKPLTELYVKELLPKTVRNDKQNFKGTVKRYTLTWRKQKMFRNAELNISRRKEISNLLRKVATQKITVDLVLQARAKLSDNKANGPEDVIVCEMIKKSPVEKICTMTKCCQERVMDIWNPPRSWKSSQTPCRTHIYLTHFLCVMYRHRAHALLKVFAVRMLTLSVLMLHPLSLLFLDGQFETPLTV